MVKDNNLKARVLSALVLGPIFIISIFYPDPLFSLLMLWVAAGMLYEWYQITQRSIVDLTLGLLLIPQAIISLVLTSYIDTNKLLLLYYFIIIWAVDTFAMIGGKTFRGRKLAPVLSPNKTWSGLITGVLGAGLMASLINLIPYLSLVKYYDLNSYQLLLSAMVIASIAQASDLLVSFFKRKYDVKDSGNVIPGHGGVLDRFDSIILTSWMVLAISQMI